MANVTGVSHLYYSDDKGKTWEHGPTKDTFQGSRFIARGDTIFAGNNSYLYMSTDNAKTWTEKLNDLNRLKATNIKFIGDNSLLVGNTVYSLSYFSVESKMSDTIINDYERHNGFEYKGTGNSFLGREIGSTTWTSLMERLATEERQISILELVPFKEVIIAVTTAGIYYSGDNGQAFMRSGSELKGVKSYFVKGEILYINALNVLDLPNNDLARPNNFYTVDMNNMKPIPLLETLAENEQVRVDTLINLKVNVFIQPRNFELSLKFEYEKLIRVSLCLPIQLFLKLMLLM